MAARSVSGEGGLSEPRSLTLGRHGDVKSDDMK